MDGMAHASSSSVWFSLGALVLLFGVGCAYSLAAHGSVGRENVGTVGAACRSGWV